MIDSKAQKLLKKKGRSAGRGGLCDPQFSNNFKKKTTNTGRSRKRAVRPPGTIPTLGVNREAVCGLNPAEEFTLNKGGLMVRGSALFRPRTEMG